jgi:hypothetical protein
MAQIPNPHYVGAPARMSDGRLFTDYRRSTLLLPKLRPNTWADYDRRNDMTRTGEMRISNDRTMATQRGGSVNCVDTMVPELTKFQYAWNGGQQRLAHPVGIGAGRLPLPGRPDLINADPDTLAAATFPLEMFPGSWDPRASLYQRGPPPVKIDVPVTPARHNRYAMPYGN